MGGHEHMQQRVLFVVDGLSGGGAEKTALRLADHMHRTGHTVAIASLRDEQAFPVPEGVALIPAFDTSPRRLRKFGEIGRRARILDEHVAPLDPWNLVISSVAQADRIVSRSSVGRSAWYRVAIQPSAEHLKGHSGFKRFRRLRRLHRTYGGRKVIAISEGVRRDLVDTLGIVPSRIETILNPVDVDEVRRLASEPCQLAGEDYLVHVGRFDPQKRHDRLLGAFARSGFSGRLVLVGTGPEADRRRVEQSIAARGLSSRVELVGFQPNPFPFIRNARALVLSSDFEGLGTVLIESLVCGTPVVSTDCPSGPAEILTGDLAVGLSELTDESLAAAIDSVLADPPTIPKATIERFAIDRIAERYLALAG